MTVILARTRFRNCAFVRLSGHPRTHTRPPRETAGTATTLPVEVRNKTRSPTDDQHVQRHQAHTMSGVQCRPTWRDSR